MANDLPPERAEVIIPEPISDDELSSQHPGGVFFQRRLFHYSFPGGGNSDRSSLPKPPTLATWLCLLAAWFFLSSSQLFTVIVGLPMNILALALALVCLTRGGIGTGLLVLLMGTVGSICVYLIGILRYLF